MNNTLKKYSYRAVVAPVIVLFTFVIFVPCLIGFSLVQACRAGWDEVRENWGDWRKACQQAWRW